MRTLVSSIATAGILRSTKTIRHKYCKQLQSFYITFRRAATRIKEVASSVDVVQGAMLTRHSSLRTTLIDPFPNIQPLVKAGAVNAASK